MYYISFRSQCRSVVGSGPSRHNSRAGCSIVTPPVNPQLLGNSQPQLHFIPNSVTISGPGVPSGALFANNPETTPGARVGNFSDQKCLPSTESGKRYSQFSSEWSNRSSILQRWLQIPTN